jgi:hypothetical protein
MGHARADITPPAGIYHPMWGAARHHRATGIHRPLFADVLCFAPAAGNDPAWVQVQLDMVGLAADFHHDLRKSVAEAAGGVAENVVLACSHTHSGGLFSLDRVALPGGELIAPYLAEARTKVATAAAQAVAAMQPATLTYAHGHCNLAANRDYWDAEHGIYTCGFNPDAPADDTVLVIRMTGADGALRGVLVNYACHPTTLAWENPLISPDYVGALRETVEQATAAPCIFTLGACGDLGPRQGFTGDTRVADANGRQLGYAVLSTLTAMDPPGQDFVYAGPVVSGATLGTWNHVPAETSTGTQTMTGGVYQVDLPQKPRRDPAALEQDLTNYLAQQAEADARGDAIAARDLGARAERARRWLNRLRNQPEGPTYPYRFGVRRMGDAFWVSLGGEPYNVIQTALRARFPDHPIVVSVLAGESGIAYLLPADRYGVGLYQEEPSILDAGCLEQLTDAVTTQIAAQV